MAKKVVIAVLALAAVAALAVLILRPEAERRAAELVERYGEAATGTEVEVGDVAIELTEGRVAMSGLRIGNPEGFETDYAVLIEEVEAALDVGSVARDVPVVTELLLDDVHINAEQRGDAINLTEIQSAMTQPTDEPGTEAEAGRIIIELFRATDARLTITSELSGRAETVDLEDVVVMDVGGTEGVTYGDAAAAVLEPVIDAAVAAVRRRLQDRVEGAAREEVEGAAEDLEQEAEERLRELLEQ